jgi:hypothetical protein
MKVKVTLEHEDNRYSFIPDKCEYDDLQGAEFMWTEGNFGCDCNKSLFIQDQCDESFPDMECGDEIKLIGIEIVE